MSSDNKGAVDPAAETHFGFQTVRADEKATLVGLCCAVFRCFCLCIFISLFVASL
jgi:hypothetical protein